MAAYVSLRKITSLTALLSFAALVISSLCVYLAPRGPGSSRWEALGLDKHEWYALHTNLGILFAVAGIVHIVLNIKPIVCYLRNRDKKLRVLTLNFNLALLLTAWVAAGSIRDWPPFDAIRELKSSMGAPARRHTEADEPAVKPMPETPPFFFSRWTLEKLCERYGLPTGPVVQQLQRFGIEAEAAQTIKTVAAANDMHPDSVYEVIRQIQLQSE